MNANVIGAGLAGSEAAYQLSKRGVTVNLYEMKPNKKTPAHKSDLFAELVCSNSLKAARIGSAAGMLKEEMRMLDSLLMKCADKSSVPAGGALAVDREIFSKLVTDEINGNENINVINQEVKSLDFSVPTVIATGPLTSDDLAKSIAESFGDSLSFFDAAAPIVRADSLDMNSAFFAS
ncbi:MAG: FAD-dependent oxidoreductase, partial [Oscillospiraceae bacterium]|nr:FAD-dependent oxidoreductase [Oscillospiraceae bacterium]